MVHFQFNKYCIFTTIFEKKKTGDLFFKTYLKNTEKGEEYTQHKNMPKRNEREKLFRIKCIKATFNDHQIIEIH